MSTMFRTRWAAVGAVVAICAGAGGIGLVDAAKGSGERSVYTAIEPCRLLDTRPDQGIGGRTAPLGPREVYPVTAHGDNGQCTGIPGDTVAVELNVTGLLNTGATHFTVWDGQGGVPNASHVNLAPGARPTPNSVTTELNGAGFAIRNNSATAHVIIDLVGIYQDHHHDDRYYTETEIDNALAAPFAVESPGSTIGIEAGFLDEPDVANSLEVDVPAPGQLVVTATGNYSAVLSEGLHASAQCTLSDDGEWDVGYRSLYEVWNAAGATGRSEVDLAITRVIDVEAAGPVDLALLCRSGDGRVLAVSRLIAQYVP